MTAEDSHWEWMVCHSWRRLHYIPESNVRLAYDDLGEPIPGVSLCGLDGLWSIPGFLSRLGLPRCAHCCRTLSIPQGNGTPANEKHAQSKANQ